MTTINSILKNNCVFHRNNNTTCSPLCHYHNVQNYSNILALNNHTWPPSMKFWRKKMCFCRNNNISSSPIWPYYNVQNYSNTLALNNHTSPPSMKFWRKKLCFCRNNYISSSPLWPYYNFQNYSNTLLLNNHTSPPSMKFWKIIVFSVGIIVQPLHLCHNHNVQNCVFVVIIIYPFHHSDPTIMFEITPTHLLWIITHHDHQWNFEEKNVFL